MSERVLCVRREELFRDGTWDGLTSDRLDDVQRLIREHSCFMPRRDVEEDPGYQQVIPYVVFRHGDRYLLTRRLEASSEKRLRHRYSLGVGGHINPEDVANGDPVLDGMRREWEEEVAYAGRITARLLGLIHEESAPVGRVHLGVVFLVEGDTAEIAIRETEKLSGELLTLDEMRIHYLEMEAWSQIVYDRLARGAGAPGADGHPVGPATPTGNAAGGEPPFLTPEQRELVSRICAGG